ncbi:MAG: amidohydrolase family protein [Oscillospiraceae bacterium]|nr:amidohydrolase family protein [Oscillospiraceae bacterium]
MPTGNKKDTAMIIDSHTHIYPDKIAFRASHAIGEYYEMPMEFDGTAENLLRHGLAAGIDKFVVCSAATTAAQVRPVNQFIAASVAAHSDRFWGYGTAHPDCTDIPAVVEEIIAAGLVGIKLHGDFQKFLIDSPAAMRIYEACEGRLPVLLHSGDYRTEYTKPARVLNIARTFPKLDIIAAHFGAWSEWGSSAAQLAEAGVYIDTCSSLYALKPRFARLLIDTFGVDHVFFGTDYPMWRTGKELEYLHNLPLTDDERRAILGENFLRFISKYEKTDGGNNNL